MRFIRVFVATALIAVGCSGPASDELAEARPASSSIASSDPHRAQDVVNRAIVAAGGLARWRAVRDAAFISTFTIFDPQGNAASETIFLNKLMLGAPRKIRLESIGIPEDLIFGFDGERDWMIRGTHPVKDPSNTAFTRFHALSNSAWFGLPFILSDPGVRVSFAGTESRGDKDWDRVRVDNPEALNLPADWLVIYFDGETGLIDRVHTQVQAEFMSYKTWLGKWRDYREVEGVQRERRRVFYPADDDGNMVGRAAADQLIEHIHFDNGWNDELFQRPLIADGGNPAG